MFLYRYINEKNFCYPFTEILWVIMGLLVGGGMLSPFIQQLFNVVVRIFQPEAARKHHRYFQES